MKLESLKVTFFKGFLTGLAWMIGATVGFALLLAFLGVLINWAETLPVIGQILADIIEATSIALEAKHLIPN